MNGMKYKIVLTIIYDASGHVGGKYERKYYKRTGF